MQPAPTDRVNQGRALEAKEFEPSAKDSNDEAPQFVITRPTCFADQAVVRRLQASDKLYDFDKYKSQLSVFKRGQGGGRREEDEVRRDRVLLIGIK